jgi:WD40 repeat protein
MNNDELYEIFTYLDIKTYCNCMKISKYWNKKLKEKEEIWYNFLKNQIKNEKIKEKIQFHEKKTQKDYWRNKLIKDFYQIPKIKEKQSIKKHVDEVWVSTWSNDGKYLFTGGKDSVLKIFKFEEELLRIIYGEFFGSPILHISTNPNFSKFKNIIVSTEKFTYFYSIEFFKILKRFGNSGFFFFLYL